MDNDEFVNRGGDYCPMCGEDNLSISLWESVYRGFARRVTCGHCGATYMKYYKLHGYYDLKAGE